MALTNAFPAGTVLTDAELNESVPLGARYNHTSAQTIANSTDVKMQFPAAVHTNTDIVASGTNNTDFALNRNGLWLVTVSVRYLGSAGAGERHLFIQTGSSFNTANRIAQTANTNVGSSPVSLSTSTVLKIAAATTIIIGLFQNSGGSLSTDNGFGGHCHLSLSWLGPV